MHVNVLKPLEEALVGQLLEHLHWCPVCGPALEIFDEVQQLYPVDPLEDCSDLGKMHSFQDPVGALEECNKQSQIVFIDSSLFPIG
jgi:hypothetical protein